MDTYGFGFEWTDGEFNLKLLNLFELLFEDFKNSQVVDLKPLKLFIVQSGWWITSKWTGGGPLRDKKGQMVGLNVENEGGFEGSLDSPLRDQNGHVVGLKVVSTST